MLSYFKMNQNSMNFHHFNWFSETLKFQVTKNWKIIFRQVYHSVSHSVLSNSLRPCGLQPARLLCPWDSPGRNTGVGSHFLLQGIFLTQGQNLAALPYRQILYHLSPQGSPGGLKVYLTLMTLKTYLFNKSATQTSFYPLNLGPIYVIFRNV